ncbi:MAG: type II toxin-antitoxin system RelE/ParE family toxin [Legionella sp.]
MTDIIIQQMPLFKKAYKKLHKQHKLVVNKAIFAIVNDPAIGEEKKGDLAGVYAYKFKISNQEFLLAYEWDPLHRLLLTLSVHENFYRDLKKHSN